MNPLHVLFIFSRIGAGGGGAHAPWMPLGILYIIAYLRKHRPDITPIFIDSNFEDIDEARMRELLKQYEPICVGIGAMSIQSADAHRIGALINQIDRNMPVVFGGVHYSFKPEDIDDLDGNNWVMCGEGEAKFLEFVSRQANHAGSISSSSHEFIQNLDDIPFPAYDMIDIDGYSDALVTGEKAFSIMTGRGCPYDCSFCGSPRIWKRKVRLHSIGYVEEHIRHILGLRPLFNLRIMDDTFCLSKKRVMDFCDMIMRNDWHFNMTCLTHVKTADQEMFDAMKTAGFSIVAFGVESGSPEILKNINKDITTEEAESAVMMAKKSGLRTECLFMIGNVGETPATIQQSIDLKNRLDSDWAYFQYATPFPGSKFYDICREHGTLLTEDYSLYDHQKPVYIPSGMTIDELVDWRRRAMS